MSERKRDRLGVCSMCQTPAKIMQHGKCHSCRIALMLNRFSKRADKKSRK